jgi:predicted permease
MRKAIERLFLDFLVPAYVFRFFYRMHLSNNEPLTSLGCPLYAVFHVLGGSVPQDAGAPLLLLLQILTNL